MPKLIEPKCKQCRREGMKLFLKGARCYSEKCAINKRNYVPGQHGNSRKRQSDFARHLREKQKVKKIYGLLESQFRRYFEEASKKKGVTGQMLLQFLEIRLDSVLFSSGMAVSRKTAKQMINQKKVKVNGQVITVPSYQIKITDKITTDLIQSAPREGNMMPEWMEWDSKDKQLVITRLPIREDINAEINEQLIVEFYSR
jgi:small subunit ribosomal protein S4